MSRADMMRVEFREQGTERLLYETRMLAVPRVGELIEFPSGRTTRVVQVGYVLDVGLGLGESHAVVVVDA